VRNGRSGAGLPARQIGIGRGADFGCRRPGIAGRIAQFVAWVARRAHEGNDGSKPVLSRHEKESIARLSRARIAKSGPAIETVIAPPAAFLIHVLPFAK